MLQDERMSLAIFSAALVVTFFLEALALLINKKNKINKFNNLSTDNFLAVE